MLGPDTPPPAVTDDRLRRLRGLPRLVLHDPQVLGDPIGTYGDMREQAPLVRLLALGLPTKWGITRFADARAMLADPRFRFTADSAITPDVPELGRGHLLATLVEPDGHRWLRATMARLFSRDRAAAFRSRVEAIVDELLDMLPAQRDNGVVDLVRHFSDPLPIDATGAFLGIPVGDRFRWRRYPEPVGSGISERFAAVMPEILDDTRRAIAHRRSQPGDDAISLLDANEQLYDELRLEGFVWVNMIASSTVSGLISNAVLALLTHPDELRALRSREVPGATAVDELVRWCGLHVLSTPRYATADVELFGVTIPAGAPVVACIAAANRDPRVFPDPDRLDLRRTFGGSPPHLGFAHGPHGCAGNPLGRVIVEVALTRLLDRFPALSLAADPGKLPRVLDPETWRLRELPVTLQPLRRGGPAARGSP